MTHNVFQLSDAPRKLRPSLSIGKFHLRTDVKSSPDLTLQIAFLNEFFYNRKDVFFLRLCQRTNDPETAYKNLTRTLRRINNGRWKREPVSGFRLCNVIQTAKAWRLVSNIACTGSRYAAVLFQTLSRDLHGQRPAIYISFRLPRQTLRHREYKRYYAEFWESSHLLQSQAKIFMLEPYYWRLECTDLAYTVQILFDIFGSRLQSIYTDPLNGIEICQSPNIDADDYFSTDRQRLSCRIRFFQPFGHFYKLLK